MESCCFTRDKGHRLGHFRGKFTEQQLTKLFCWNDSGHMLTHIASNRDSPEKQVAYIYYLAVIV